MCLYGWKRYLWLAIVISSLTQAMLSPAAVLSEEDESDKHVFMFLYRNATSEVDLSPEDALNSDLIRSEYNLQQEREKRDIESSGDDVNECLDPVLNTCLQNCTNTDGGYNCSCFDGFEGTGNNCTEGYAKKKEQCRNSYEYSTVHFQIKSGPRSSHLLQRSQADTFSA